MGLPTDFDKWPKRSQAAFLRTTKQDAKGKSTVPEPGKSKFEGFHHGVEQSAHGAAHIAEFFVGLYLGLRGAISGKDR